MTSRFIKSDELLKLLTDRGLVNEHTQRVVIDLKAGCPPVMFVQHLGEPNLFVELVTDLVVTDEPQPSPKVPTTVTDNALTDAKDTDNER